MRFRVEVPGSTSNLGPGFDCLGLALDLPLLVEVETRGSQLQIEVAGPETEGIALDANNLIYASMARILRRHGVREPGMVLRIENHIPLQRGLGSSGAAAVAGVVLGHLLAGQTRLERSLLMQEAVEIEGHPDNVAPSVFGGFLASAQLESGARALPLEFPADLRLLLVVPDRGIATVAARDALPSVVSRHDAVYNISRLGMLLAALGSRAYAELRDAMRDRLHQDHRLALLPGLADALNELLAEPDCLAATISGSGPTLLALHRHPTTMKGQGALAALERHGTPARLRAAEVQRDGARWSRSQSA